MNSKEYTEQDILQIKDISEIKNDVSYLKLGMNDIKLTERDHYSDLKERLENINNSTLSLRHDVDIANSKNIEQDFILKDHDIRLKVIEKTEIKQSTIFGAVLGIIRNIGFSNIILIIIAILYFFAHFTYKII